MNNPVDRSGRDPLDHAAAIAKSLGLNERQTKILVSELRNALLPEHYFATGDHKHGGLARVLLHRLDGVKRVLLLANALSDADRKRFKFLCPECGERVFEMYMLHDELWARVAADGARVLHLACVEKRLGRQLTIDDFDLAGRPKAANAEVAFGFEMGKRFQLKKAWWLSWAFPRELANDSRIASDWPSDTWVWITPSQFFVDSNNGFIYYCARTEAETGADAIEKIFAGYGGLRDYCDIQFGPLQRRIDWWPNEGTFPRFHIQVARRV